MATYVFCRGQICYLLELFVVFMSLLQSVNSSADIKKLKVKELELLANEIRSQILDVTKNNGGHLSSNLGIVETTIAIHHTFDLPNDKLIFDVGHQCYTHKILSGRNEGFSSIRTQGGLSGFPDREESDYDVISTGHAGTSISAGLGLCSARDKLGQDYAVICVVGDGSLVNGLNLEALNASNIKPKNFIVIVNDNGMSISKNKNGFYKLISKSTTKKGYVKGKRNFKKVFGNSFITRFLSGVKDFIKRLFNATNYFEKMGFKYVGVLDGNNVKEMTTILERVKDTAKDRAVLLHVNTTKGKGLEVAEQNSDEYHGVSKNYMPSPVGFSTALGNAINNAIEKDNSIVAITAGMKDGTGLKQVEASHPENFYDVGIAEEYAVTLASGMAIGGLKPVVAMYSTFLQRAYDQVLHDVCAQKLPVVFCIDRAGFVGEDGKTHQGLFDLSFLMHIPNLTLLSPIVESQVESTLNYALTLNSPVAIRYPKNSGLDLQLNEFDGKWINIYKNNDSKITFLAVGPRMVNLAMQFNQRVGNKCSIVAVTTIKPLDSQLLNGLEGTVVTLEENVLFGGFGQTVTAFMADNNKTVKVIKFGVDDCFVKHGSVSEQMQSCNLTVQDIYNTLNENGLSFTEGDMTI